MTMDPKDRIRLKLIEARTQPVDPNDPTVQYERGVALLTQVADRLEAQEDRLVEQLAVSVERQATLAAIDAQKARWCESIEATYALDGLRAEIESGGHCK